MEEVLKEQVEQNLGKIVDEYLEDILGIIKEGYPDIDIFTRVRYTEPKKTKEIVDRVKAENPGIKLFYIDIPYFGIVVYRAQTLKDTRELASEGMEYSAKLIEERGGNEKINKMDEQERARIHREVNDKVTEKISISTMKRCTLYPSNFSALVDDETLPYGVEAVLLDSIVDASGYQNVKIEEI